MRDPKWEKLSDKEKIEELKISLDAFVNHVNGAFQRTLSRLEKLEASLEARNNKV